MLHPSGYCAHFHESGKKNLIAGAPCPECKKVAGHKHTCPLYNEITANENFKSTRSKLYNATAILWHRSASVNFFTFTLPARGNTGIYQNSSTCETTGDLATTRTFSKLLENVSVNIKRNNPETVDRETGEITPKKFSYVWVAEAQMLRQKKFGGAGDIHYHLVTDAYIPIVWITNYWSELLKEKSKNCVHVEHIPPGKINSIPAYLSKYLGKGSQRTIVSRRIGTTADLSGYAPLKFNVLPAGTIEREQHFTTASGYETSMYYFNTYETLNNYGELMQSEKRLKNTSSNKHFNNDQIAWREVFRKRKQLEMYSKPLNLNNENFTNDLCNQSGNDSSIIECPF
jgi:hypothetical protein